MRRHLQTICLRKEHAWVWEGHRTSPTSQMAMSHLTPQDSCYFLPISLVPEPRGLSPSSGDWGHVAPRTEAEASGLSTEVASSGLEPSALPAAIPDITLLHTPRPLSLSHDQTQPYFPAVIHLNRIHSFSDPAFHRAPRSTPPRMLAHSQQ